MSVYDNIECVNRKSMVMFFLIDTSESMAGRSIAQLNDAIREITQNIKAVSDSNPDTCIKLAMMDFSDNPKWITPKPQELSEIKWSDLSTGGEMNMGKAFIELNKKLNRNEFLNETAGMWAPVIILLTDGASDDNYKKGIEELNQNKYFQKSLKIALGTENANMSVLQEFTGSKDTAIYIKDKALVKRFLRNQFHPFL